MYHTTGLTKARITELCARIEERGIKPGMRPWPPILGLRNALTVTLTYLRRNRVQEEIAEDYGVSQPTISRAISAITPILVQVLLECVPAADELDDGRQFIVDGTLLPCWSWAAHPDLYSGKHKTTGMKVLVACTLEGHLSWISDPVPGKRHDNYCLGESQVLEDADPHALQETCGRRATGLAEGVQHTGQQDSLGDRAGNRELQDLADHAHRLRRPVETFTTTISAVIGLHFYRMA